MVIRVASSVIATVIAETARAAPAECCGLLLGRDAIERAVPAANVAADPLCQFEIDPSALILAHRAARSGGPKVLGYYHSHPSGHPVPSPTDCQHAGGDGAIWAIVVGDEIGFWRDTPGGFAALSYALVDG